jgi:hypothetical protein
MVSLLSPRIFTDVETSRAKATISDFMVLEVFTAFLIKVTVLQDMTPC